MQVSSFRSDSVLSRGRVLFYNRDVVRSYSKGGEKWTVGLGDWSERGW